MIARTLLLSVLASLALASPAAAKTLVNYQRSGGIAGITDTTTVSDAGAVRNTSSRGRGPRSYKLTAAELRGLRRDLRAARFSTLRAVYKSKTPVADGITQTVGYAGRRVTVGTGARPPERLIDLLERLGRLARRDR